MKSLFPQCGFALFLTAFASIPATAQDVTVCFEGTVRPTGGASDADPMAVLTPIKGEFTFNLQTVDSNSAANIGAYRYVTAPYGIKVRVGTDVFRSHPLSPNFALELVKSLQGNDYFVLRSFNNVATNGLHPDTIILQLQDGTGALLPSAELSAGLPGDALLWNQGFGLQIENNVAGLSIAADIAAFTASADCGVADPMPVGMGPKGDKGDKGDAGPKGDQGDPGPKGDKGDTGDVGPKGDRGDTGLLGPQGEQGIAGAKGDQGERGVPGLKGEQGEPGVQGQKGEKGDPGTPGTKGDKGDRGEGLFSGSLLFLPVGSAAPEGYTRIGTFMMIASDYADTWENARSRVMKVDMYYKN